MESRTKNWNIRKGDFCVVDPTYMQKLCERRRHYGNVFAVLPLPEGKPGFIVGLKLVTTCVCKTVSDGVYQGQLRTPKPFPSRCLFVNALKLTPVWFKESLFEEFHVHDICQVFLPSIDLYYFGVIRSIQTRRNFQIQLFDYSCQFVENFNLVNPEFQENFVDGPNVLVTLKWNFVDVLFRCSEVRKDDICILFVPGQGKFQCLFEKRIGSKIQVRLLKGKIDMIKVDVDDRFFQKISEDQFSVKEIFLQFVETRKDQNSKSRSFCEKEDYNRELFESIYGDNQCQSTKHLIYKNFRVTLLEGNIDVAKVKIGDHQIFRKAGDGKFDVSEKFLELLVESTATSGSEREINLSQNLRVKAGDICRLNVPGQGKFPCLVDRRISHDDLSGVYECDEGPKSDTCPDGQILKRIGESQFAASINLLELLQSTTGNAKGPENTPRGSSAIKGDICTLNVPGQGKFQCLVEGQLSKNIVQVSLLDGVIDMARFKKNASFSENINRRTLSQSDNFGCFEPKSMVVKESKNYEDFLGLTEGDICKLLVPGQGKFQCLVERRFDRNNFVVSILEGNIDMARVDNDVRGFRKVDEKRFCVNEIYLELLQSTARKVELERFRFAEMRSGHAKQDDVSKFCLQTLKPMPFVRPTTHIGRFKGIQGRDNSCYMDTLLYSLFLFNDSLDQIFEPSDDDEPRDRELKTHFRCLIVNPLRSEKCYVTYEHVMQFRRMLEPYLPGVCNEAKDTVDLLRVLFSENFAGKQDFLPLLQLKNSFLNEDQNLSVYEIIIPADNKFKVSIPHLGNLLSRSFVFQGHFLKKNPQTFLIQLPRFGKEKLFPGVYLPPELDISLISANREHKCCKCDDLAVLRCSQCSSQKFFSPNITECFSIANFCNKCFDTSHRNLRETHQKEFIPPLKVLENSNTSSCLYFLQAVICIETRHYVSFVRAKKEKRPQEEFCWLFFDSMADAAAGSYEDFYSDHNIPEVREAFNIESHLDNLGTLTTEMRYDYVISRSFSKEHELFKRLIQDAYICVYIQK